MRMAAALIVCLSLCGCSDDDKSSLDAAVDMGAVDAPAPQPELGPDALPIDAPSGDQGLPDQSGWPTGTCVVDLSCSAKSECVAQGWLDCVGGKCIKCKVDGDCTGFLDKGCDTASGLCRAMCATDADCTASGVELGTGKCDSDTWICLRCDSDADCLGVPGSAKLCGTLPGSSTKQCVGCASDADCVNSPLKGCDTTTGTCSRCKSNAECCLGGASSCPVVCDKAFGACRCGSDQQCQTAYGSVFWGCQSS